MFRTKLALIASLFLMTLSIGCVTDETDTIDPAPVDDTLERDNDDDRGGGGDTDPDCHRLANGEYDCPIPD